MSTLAFLRSMKVDGKNIYSKRIQFAIQDVIDLRKNGWKKKIYKEGAKKRADIDPKEIDNPTKVEFAEEI